MTERQPYSYVLLRYRHDPVAGEFVNVGVILYAPESHFVGARVRKTLGRLGKVFPGIQKVEISGALNSIDRAVTRICKEVRSNALFERKFSDAEQIARAVLPDDESSYFWGPLCSGVASDPSAALDKVYARFVSRYDDEPKPGRDDAAVWQPVKEALTARRLIDRLHPKLISSPIDEVEFSNAWKNGVWHCYQPLSFDLGTPEGIRDKAARWSGHMTGLSKAAEEIQPYFIVGSPSEPSLAAHYAKAIALLRASSLNPLIFEEERSDELAELIASQMAGDATASV